MSSDDSIDQDFRPDHDWSFEFECESEPISCFSKPWFAIQSEERVSGGSVGALPLYVSEVVSRVLFHYRMLPGKGMRLPFLHLSPQSNGDTNLRETFIRMWWRWDIYDRLANSSASRSSKDEESVMTCSLPTIELADAPYEMKTLLVRRMISILNEKNDYPSAIYHSLLLIVPTAAWQFSSLHREKSAFEFSPRSVTNPNLNMFCFLPCFDSDNLSISCACTRWSVRLVWPSLSIL